MARVRIKKKATPKFMQNTKKSLDEVKTRSQSELLAMVAKDLSDMGYDAKRTPKYVIATEARMRKEGLIDLKYRFSRSSKRKATKDGTGWYMVIPIQKKARDFNPNTVYKRALRKGKTLGAGESATFDIKGLADGVNKGKAETLHPIDYKAKSNSLTIGKNKSRKRTSYVALRTVSSKSSPSSWILNRSNMNSKNTGKTLQKDIERTIAWKLKNMGGKS